MGRASSGDKIVEVLVVGLGGVGSKGFVGGPIRQLTASLSKAVILVQDNHGDALMRMLGLVKRKQRTDFFDLERLGCGGEILHCSS